MGLPGKSAWVFLFADCAYIECCLGLYAMLIKAPIRIESSAASTLKTPVIVRIECEVDIVEEEK